MNDLELMNLIRSAENLTKRSGSAKKKKTGNGRIMRALYESGKISQSKLAEMIDIRPQSLTRALSSLEENGYICRRREENDRRIVTVSMTKEGKEHHRKIAKEREKQASLIFDCLSENEKDELARLLNKVISAYKDQEDRND